MIKDNSISLCMIVKNEERCLERCLQSVQGKVQEIIIVDTGSSDQTKEIAQKYTNQIYDFKWINDFAAARNFALGFASGDYILHLDADEVLEDPENELQHPLDVEFYYLRIKNDLGHGSFLTHQFIRLFKNSPDIRYHGALHEQVKIDHNVHQTGYLSTVIFHDGYRNNIVKDKQKVKRNQTILLSEIKENPTAFNYYNLGMQYIMAEQYDKALQALKKSYTLGNQYTFSQKVVLDIMKCLHEMKQYEEVIKVGNDAVKLYDNVPDFFYQMGLSYEAWGLIKDAEDQFKKCLEIGEESTHQLLNHYEGTGSYMAQGELADISLMLGKTQEALEYILQAVKASPDTLALFYKFLSIYPNTQSKEMFRIISQIWPFKPERYIEFIGLLYQQRNPLLNEFISYFEMDVIYPVSVLFHIIEGNYARALEELGNHQDILEKKDNNMSSNVLLLSVLTNNAGLIDKFKNEIPLSSKELKWFKHVVESKTAGSDLSLNQTLRTAWRQLITDLIRFQKYEHVNVLVNATNQAEIRYIIADCLQSFGFDELALEVLVESDNQNINHKIYLVAAKCLRKLGALDDALYYLKMAEKIKSDYSNLFEQWEIFNIMDRPEAVEILQKIVDKYPESDWAKRTLNQFSWTSNI